MEKPDPRVLLRPPPPGAEAGIDEAMIRRVVDAFYARIRQDELLGPLFAAHVQNWDEHLPKMYDFWSSLLLMTKRYNGRPVPAHVKISDSRGDSLGPEHFARWLELFAETSRDICPPSAAELFIERAQRVAQSLQLSIDWQHGRLPPLKAPIRSSSAV